MTNRLIFAILLLSGFLYCPFSWGGTRPDTAAAAATQDYVVIARYPHDTGAFTQGLVYHDGWLYEGTGQLGASTLRRVDLATGSVEQQTENSADIFGEGITLLNDAIYQLTWRNRKVIVYAVSSLRPTREFVLNTEGWGITHNGKELIVSDGSSTLYFYDPLSFREVRRVSVSDASGAVPHLNELEYIDGYVYANRWLSNHIFKINPDNGSVVARIDLSRLVAEVRDRLSEPDSQGVLNGIAWDSTNGLLLVTGKYWPTLFAIRWR